MWQNPPGWTNYPIVILALIPGLWLLGRYVRWRSYDVALTSTRILVRQGIFGRDTVQLRLQRITEVNIRQALFERLLGTGSLVIDVQGEDDSHDARVHAQAGHRPARHQLADQRDRGRRPPRADPRRTCCRATSAAARRRDGRRPRRPTTTTTSTTRRPSASARRATERQARHAPRPEPARAAGAATRAPLPFEIRDRLIELDDLRRRGILSEEEFAAKKSQLLNRI